MDKSKMQSELCSYLAEKDCQKLSSGFQSLLEIIFDPENSPNGIHLETDELLAIDFLMQFNRVVRG